MRAIPVSTQTFLLPLQPHSSIFLSHPPFHFTPSPKPCSLNSYSKITTFLHRASKPNPTTLNDTDDSGTLLVIEDDEVEDSDSLVEDGVYIEVTKLEKNSRRIESRISINASLDSIWSILTDYERLADFIPGLALSKLIQKGPNFARLLQVKYNWGFLSLSVLFVNFISFSSYCIKI